MTTVILSAGIAAVAAFVLGVVIAALKGASTAAALKADLRSFQENAERLQAELSAEKGRAEENARQCQTARDEWVRTQAQLESSGKEIDRLKKEHDDALARLKTQTEELIAKLQATSEATVARLQKELLEQNAKCITDNSKTLKDTNAEQLNIILKPFREQYAELQKTLAEQQKSSVASAAKFDEQYRAMLDSAKAIGDRTSVLQNVLMGSNKAQGNWGEYVLEQLLESAGLQKGVHFETQRAAGGGDDSGVGIPDATLFLPEDRVIYIDSKANIKALYDLEKAKDDAQRDACRKAFLEGVKAQIRSLDRKAYQKRAKESNKETLDFVIMFIPSEGAFRCLLESGDKTILEKFTGHDVVLTGPSTLFPVLKLIHQQWRNFQTIRNQELIQIQLDNFMKRIEGFLTDFMQIQTELKQCSNAFEQAQRRLIGNQGALVSARTIMKLSGKSNKKLEQMVGADVVDVTDAAVDDAAPAALPSAQS